MVYLFSYSVEVLWNILFGRCFLFLLLLLAIGRLDLGCRQMAETLLSNNIVHINIYIYSTNIFIYTEYFTMLSRKTLECVGVCVVVKLKAQLRTVSEQSSTRNALGYISQLRKISRFVTAMEFRSSRLFASTL